MKAKAAEALKERRRPERPPERRGGESREKAKGPGIAQGFFAFQKFGKSNGAVISSGRPVIGCVILSDAACRQSLCSRVSSRRPRVP